MFFSEFICGTTLSPSFRTLFPLPSLRHQPRVNKMYTAPVYIEKALYRNNYVHSSNQTRLFPLILCAAHTKASTIPIISVHRGSVQADGACGRV